jgi:hypothetical protein
MVGGGRLLFVEPTIGPSNEPACAVFSDSNMLVMPGGRERTSEAFERLYAEPGFEFSSEIVRTGSLFAVIEGAASDPENLRLYGSFHSPEAVYHTRSPMDAFS